MNELLAVLQGRRERRRLRRRHPKRHHRHAGEPVLPVSRRAAFRRDCSAGDKYTISDLELASNLSFFLWNSIPDDELLDLAIKGQARAIRAVLDKQVLRMLADPRSITLASNFVHQWLDMKRLNEIVPDNDVFPYASGRSDPRAGFPHRTHAVFRQHLQGRPQRRRSAESEPHVSE